jgi:hypothetical protein
MTWARLNLLLTIQGGAPVAQGEIIEQRILDLVDIHSRDKHIETPSLDLNGEPNSSFLLHAFDAL